VVKGGPQPVASLIPNAPDWGGAVDKLAADGYRVLAVAAGTGNDLELAGLVALTDPPREDSRALIERLHRLGVRVTMVTGDGPTTARAVDAQVGMGDAA